MQREQRADRHHSKMRQDLHEQTKKLQISI